MERTRMVCYEDVLSDHGVQTLSEMMQFWFNTTDLQWTGREPKPEYSGGHATSKDPALKEQLREAIKTVDEKYYNGAIAWLDSELPC